LFSLTTLLNGAAPSFSCFGRFFILRVFRQFVIHHLDGFTGELHKRAIKTTGSVRSQLAEAAVTARVQVLIKQGDLRLNFVFLRLIFQP